VSKIVSQKKGLAVFNTLCYGAKCKSMSEMLCAKVLKQHAQNIETSCQNIMLKI